MVELSGRTDQLLATPVPVAPAPTADPVERDLDLEEHEAACEEWTDAVGGWVAAVLQTCDERAVERVSETCEALWWRVSTPKPRWYTWPYHCLAVMGEMADRSGYAAVDGGERRVLIDPDAFVRRHWPTPLADRFPPGFHFQQHVLDRCLVHLRTQLHRDGRAGAHPAPGAR